MNYLVTGGLGFIGSKLISKILQNPNNKVCIIDNGSITESCLANPDIKNWIHYFDENLDSNFNTLINKNIIDCNLEKIVDKFEVIFHLAANPGVQKSIKDPVHDFEQNFETTFRLLEAIRVNKNLEKKKFIFSSSAAPLAGNNTFPIHENLPIRPLSPYGASKASAEAYILAYKKTYGLNSNILRFSNVYGPGSLAKTSVVSKMIKQAFKKKTITIYGDGGQTRDFIFIDDLINILYWCASNKVSFENPLHICTELPTKIIDIAKLIKFSIEKQCKNIKSIDIVFERKLLGDAYQNYSSVDYLKSLNAPKVNFLNQNLIDQTVSWFIENIDNYKI